MTTTQPNGRCRACDHAVQPYLDPGVPVWRCHACGTRMLAENYEAPASDALDEMHRVAALGELRTAAARRLLSQARALGVSPPGRLLDVGCSYGWFLAEAAREGWVATGIDPDASSVARARARGCDVTVGRFPDDLNNRGPYDIVTFNDVFEHLREPLEVLDACRSLLATHGVVVLNLPSARGLLFRLAETACRAGVRGPLARLFQLGFPSPHYHYYAPPGIRRLAARAGFDVVAQHALPIVTWGSLRARVAMDREQTRGQAALSTAALGVLLPLLAVVPAPDVEVFYLRTRGAHAR